MGEKRVVVKKKVRKKIAKEGSPAHSEPTFLSSKRVRPTGVHALRKPGQAKARPVPSRGGPEPYYPPDPEFLGDQEFGIGDVVPYLVVLLCLALVVFIFLPVNLSHVDGHRGKAVAGADSRNLLREAQKALLDPAGPETVSFTEAEVNAYLRQRLESAQQGPLKLISGVDGVFVDIKDKAATLYLVERFLGLPFVVSTTWSYYLENQRYIRECTGSSVGRLHFDGARIGPLMTPFIAFARACKPEAIFLEQVEGVQNVQLEPGVLKLQFHRKPDPSRG